MSYNFAITIPPVPKNDEEAWEWVNEQSSTYDNDPPSIYYDFVNVLRIKYPCFSDVSENEHDRIIWSDGPILNNLESKAPVLGIRNSRVRDTFPTIVKTANSFNLTVFDFQSETIFRPGGISGVSAYSNLTLWDEIVILGKTIFWFIGGIKGILYVLLFIFIVMIFAQTIF